MDMQLPEWLPQMEAVLESLNEGVLISNDCPEMLWVNQCFLQMCGYQKHQILGLSPLCFYSGSDADFLQQQILRGEHAGHNRFEFYLPRQDGTRVPVVISSRVIEDPDGQRFAIVTFTDISEQKQVAARLQSAHEELARRYAEVEEELTLAARVQQSLTPQALLWGNLAVEAFYQPVRTIGGDFGLVNPSGAHHLNLMVCDVSGHGISSALLANRIYTEVISQLERGAGLRQLLREVNDFVLQHLGTSVYYFTLAAARIDRAAKHLEFAGAGHPPAIIVDARGRARLLKSLSTILGVLPGAVPAAPDGDAVTHAELHRGDRLLLYTDGLTEVFNAQREMLGVPGLQKIAEQAAALPLPQMKNEILDRIAAWRFGPPADDMSLVLAEVLAEVP